MANYLDFALAAPGVQRHRFTRELLTLSRQVTCGAFIQLVQRALRYRIVDRATLERIAWLCLSQTDEALPQADVDEDFQQRPAYQAGCLTDAPDLSVYDQLFDQYQEHQDENGNQDNDEDENENDNENARDDDDRPW